MSAARELTYDEVIAARPRRELLYSLHEQARRRMEQIGEYIAGAVVDGHKPLPKDVEDYRWARDCQRINFAMWHVEVMGGFPEWWQKRPAAVSP